MFQKTSKKNSKDDIPDRNQLSRADTEEPETEYTGGTFLEDVEHWIPSLFEPARQGINSLKKELESDVDESNWFRKAAGTSALAVLDAAMSFTEGIPLGMLDTRRFGEGFAEGTWEGAKKDISRALNVLPQGKFLKAADRALTVENVIEQSSSGNLQGAAYAAGFGILSTLGHTKGSKVDTRIDPKKTKAYKTLISDEILEARDAPKAGNSDWSLHERKNNWGKRNEHYIGYIKDKKGLSTNTVQIDGLWATSNKMLVLVESKWGNPNTPIDYSKHWMDPKKKVDQIKRYLKLISENPNEISHMQIVVSVGQVGEIFLNIVSQKLPASALTKIDLVLR